MPTNRRPSHGQFAAAVLPGGTAVFRSAPGPSASTTTMPAAGATPTAHVWVECYPDGATTPSYILQAPAGIPVPASLTKVILP